MKNCTALKSALFIDVMNFNNKIIGTEQPESARLLTTERLAFAIGVLNEEIDEFEAAHKSSCGNVLDACDAMIDLIYYAFGRMYEMGITPLQFVDMWDQVHNANMQKEKGNKSRGSEEDAIKPAGWQAPDFTKGLLDPMLLDSRKAIYGPGNNNYGRDKFIPHGAISGRILSSSSLELFEIPKPFMESAELRKKKGEDYRSGGVEMKDYFPFGLKSYVTMIHTKSLRLVSLLSSGNTPNHESVRDTLLDMMNYACFAIEAIDKEEV